MQLQLVCSNVIAGRRWRKYGADFRLPYINVLSQTNSLSLTMLWSPPPSIPGLHFGPKKTEYLDKSPKTIDTLPVFSDRSEALASDHFRTRS